MTAPYEMWAWLVEEADGEEGVVAAVIPQLGPSPIPLHSRKRSLAMSFEPVARAHSEASGRPVRLAHLVEVKGETP
jgi:hypothetical protein